jgi:hypothetical protein
MTVPPKTRRIGAPRLRQPYCPPGNRSRLTAQASGEAALWLSIALLAGCAHEPFELNTSEQHLIGRPETQVVECFGQPKQKQVDGATSTWTYDVSGASPCSLSVVFKGGYVSRVVSVDSGGHPLPPGQQCWATTLGWCSTTTKLAPAPSASKK